VNTNPNGPGSEVIIADHPLDRGLAEIGELLRNGVTSPAELCHEALQRLSGWEPTLNAFITVCAEEATTRAQQLGDVDPDARVSRPLLGVPIAIKDNLDLAGVRTTAGSAAIDYLARTTAPSVKRLLDAGAIVIGKTNLPELAYGPADTYVFGPTWNPWKVGHFAGGSSMGSGAAVAAGVVPAAVGSDTSGSVRNPAGWSGITGLKPTRGLVPLKGMVPLAPGLDHIGPMGRSALDCAILLDVMAGYDSTDPRSDRRARSQMSYAGVTTLSPSPARIGVIRNLFDYVQGDAAEAMGRALDTMAGLGAQLIDVDIPLWGDAASAALLILECQAAASHAELLASAPDLLQAQTRERLERGAQVSSVAYIRADFVSREFGHHLAKILDEVDVLALPARERTAPPMEPTGLRAPGDQGHLFNTPFNLAGLPAIVLPVGFDRQGLPVGLQLATNRWRDAALLRLAHSYQQHTDWHTHRPTFSTAHATAAQRAANPQHQTSRPPSWANSADR